MKKANVFVKDVLAWPGRSQNGEMKIWPAQFKIGSCKLSLEKKFQGLIGIRTYPLRLEQTALAFSPGDSRKYVCVHKNNDA